MLRRVLGAVGVAALTVLVGAWTAVCAVAVHSQAWGLALGLGASFAALLATPRGAARAGFVLGWELVLMMAVLGRPEGDWVIMADALGYTLLGAALVLLVLGVATLPVRPVVQPAT